MDTGITPAPTGLGLEFGPRMMVVPAQPGTTTVDLYRQFISAPESCPAHQPTVAIVRTGVLNSPDQVALRSSQRRGATFTLELEIRRFDGPLAGNDPWVALIQVDLGALDPGSYQLVAQETVLRFTDLHHPERATDPASREQRMSFDCR